MKGKLILQIIIILLISTIILNYIYSKNKTEYVSNEINNIYVLQEGVYIDKSSIRGITVPYITIKENQKYYTYLGMTLDKKVAEKIKEIYKTQNINTYIKEETVNNQQFVSELSQYDILLKDATSFGTISNILNTILSNYEDLVRN